MPDPDGSDTTQADATPKPPLDPRERQSFEKAMYALSSAVRHLDDAGASIVADQTRQIRDRVDFWLASHS